MQKQEPKPPDEGLTVAKAVEKLVKALDREDVSAEMTYLTTQGPAAVPALGEALKEEAGFQGSSMGRLAEALARIASEGSNEPIDLMLDWMGRDITDLYDRDSKSGYWYAIFSGVCSNPARKREVLQRMGEARNDADHPYRELTAGNLIAYENVTERDSGEGPDEAAEQMLTSDSPQQKFPAIEAFTHITKEQISGGRVSEARETLAKAAPAMLQTVADYVKTDKPTLEMGGSVVGFTELAQEAAKLPQPECFHALGMIADCILDAAHENPELADPAARVLGRVIPAEVPGFGKTLVTKVAGEDEKSPVALTALAVMKPEQLIGCANIAHMTEMTLIGTALHLQGPNAFLLLVHEIDSGDRERVVKGLTLMAGVARHLHDPERNPERVLDNQGTYDFLLGGDMVQHLSAIRSPDDEGLNHHIDLFENMLDELRQMGPPGS